METNDDGFLAASDQMAGVRTVLLALVLLAFAAVSAIALDIGLRSSRQDTAARMLARSLGISTLALWPPGHPLNQPLAVHPGVDLRLAPNVPPALLGGYPNSAAFYDDVMVR
jgi:hypothetical protein